MRLAFLLLLPLAACHHEPDRLLPGPCNTEDGDARYEYDASDRIVHFLYDADEGVEHAEVTWTRDGAGAVTAMQTNSFADLEEHVTSTWTFTDTEVTQVQTGDNDTTFVYEPDLRFFGDPFEIYALWRLDAPDSLLSTTGDEGNVTYTYDGPPHQGTRTRTGSDGSTAVFVYDADGRITSTTVGAEQETYTYDDAGRVIHQGDFGDYIRDSYGNLLRTNRTYEYGCWKD